MNQTVLVCDDAPYMRTLMRRILERGGFNVVGEAESGTAAVSEYQRLNPDVVTMDIVMGDMGGLSAAREIRKHDPDARILMCSAIAPPALVEEAMQAGASEFVVKPFQPNGLLEAMQRVLG